MLNAIHDKSSEAFQERNNPRRNELNQLIDQFIPLEIQVVQLISGLDVDDEEHIIGEMDEETDKRVLPNYAHYYDIQM